MNIRLNIDTRDFNQALRAYAATARKSGDDIVNTAAMHMAYTAVQHTRHANQADIAALKQAAATEISRATKTGKTRFLSSYKTKDASKHTIYKATDRAFMIYLWQLRQMGKSPRSFSNRETLMTGALRMVNARMSSVHWLRSGWLKAANKLRGVVKSSREVAPVTLPRRRAGVGGARISSGGKHAAVIWNGSLYSRRQKSVVPALVQYATEGLTKAAAVGAEKLRVITTERLARAADKFNRS